MCSYLAARIWARSRFAYFFLESLSDIIWFLRSQNQVAENRREKVFFGTAEAVARDPTPTPTQNSVTTAMVLIVSRLSTADLFFSKKVIEHFQIHFRSIQLMLLSKDKWLLSYYRRKALLILSVYLSLFEILVP